MANIFKIKDWLNGFLAERGLTEPDGRHLYQYHSSPEEYRVLENGLRLNVEYAHKFSCSTSLDLGMQMHGFSAVFVLYAALCWQQRYEGTRWKYEVILESLGASNPPASQKIQQLVQEGLRFWRLEKNKSGYAFLGAIAREAGLPQKLLAEHRGGIGRILHTVLHEAVRSGQTGNIIHEWINNCKDFLPQSYQHEEILDQLSDSINAILEIRHCLKNDSSLETAMIALEADYPDWRSRFPLPLYDDSARDLLNRLIEDAADSSATQKTGRTISVQRSIARDADNTWMLLARLEMPSLIDTGFERDKMPRTLAMRLQAGQVSHEAVLKKHPDGNSYYFQQKHIFTFSRNEAAKEIIISFTDASGVLANVTCRGGMELDDDLPWIFEGQQYEYRFRQQGGGSVRGNTAYAALTEGWTVEGSEDVGPLQGMKRRVYRLTKNCQITKNIISYGLRLATISQVEWSWSSENRFWDVEAISPTLVYRGLPRALPFGYEVRSRTAQELSWHQQGSNKVLSLASSTTAIGVGTLWFTDSATGNSLRNRMVLLPPNASLFQSANNDGTAIIELRRWQASSVAITPEYDYINCVCSRDADSLTLRLAMPSEHIPPEFIELFVYWDNTPVPAHIRLPFPQKGAHLYAADGHELSDGSLICISNLYGLRLHCFIHDESFWGIRISNDNGKQIYYPIVPQKGCTTLRLIDWKGPLLKMLSLNSDFDAQVIISIIADNGVLARWPVARYEGILIPTETDVALSLPPGAKRTAERYNIKAIHLSHPEESARVLQEGLTEGGEPSGRWETTNILDKPGPWLIYDDTQSTTLRPVLCTIREGKETGRLNCLQAAIAIDDREKRENAFLSCIDAMRSNFSAPEWETLSMLLKTLNYLPLSVLELWKTFIQSSSLMAAIALNPRIPDEAIARFDTELPFIWNLLSKLDWEMAGKALYNYYKSLLHQQDLAQQIYFDKIKERLEKLGAICPSINALIKIALPMPCYEKDRERIQSRFKYTVMNSYLYSGETCPFQNLLRSHADQTWPSVFSRLVHDARTDSMIKPYLKFDDDKERNSVLGLPILLALQAYCSRELFFKRPIDQDMIFNMRTVESFDYDWFENASLYTTYCCLSENFYSGN